MKKFERNFRILLYILAAVAILSYLSGCTNALNTSKPPVQEACPSPDTVIAKVAAAAAANNIHPVLREFQGERAIEFLRLFKAYDPTTSYVADRVMLYQAKRDRDLVVFIFGACLTAYAWPTAAAMDGLLQKMDGEAA